MCQGRPDRYRHLGGRRDVLNALFFGAPGRAHVLSNKELRYVPVVTGTSLPEQRFRTNAVRRMIYAGKNTVTF